jgi:hypothetical protein
MLMPSLYFCPPGSYAVSIYMGPTDYRPGDQNMANNWIGTVNMTCSDGTMFSVNTIPGFKSQLPDGSSTAIEGEQQAAGVSQAAPRARTAPASCQVASAGLADVLAACCRLHGHSHDERLGRQLHLWHRRAGWRWQHDGVPPWDQGDWHVRGRNGRLALRASQELPADDTVLLLR